MIKKHQRAITIFILVIFLFSNLGINNVLAVSQENTYNSIKKRDTKAIKNSEINNSNDSLDQNKINISSECDNSQTTELRYENSDFNSLESKINNIAEIDGMKGDFSVDKFSGASTYSYNIELPLARTLTPDFNIYYNSLNNKYSFLGYGWNLSMSYIGFRPKLGIDNMYNDNEFEISFQGSHGKLIATENNKYVLEKEGSFLNIEKLPEYWLITDKDGVKYYFGNSINSKHFNNSLNQVYRWYLNKVEDPHHNYLSYEYLQENQAIYPKRIQYTGYLDQEGDKEIRFQPYYDQSFSEEKNIINYKGGFRQEIDYLLDSIEVFVHSYSEQPIYYYNFSYDENKLTSIQEVGQDINGNNLSYPETSFEYYDNQRSFNQNYNSSLPDNLNFSYITNNHIYENNEIRWFDVNGDGSEDIVKSIEINGEIFSEVYLNNQGNFSLSDINVPIPFVQYGAYNNYPNGKINLALEIFDINGDNLSDLVQSYEYNNQIYSNVYLNNGAGFDLDDNYSLPIAFALNTQGDFDKYYDYKIFDINGDNLSDLVQSYEYNNQIYSNVYLNNGNGEFIQSDYPNLPLAFEFRNNQGERSALYSTQVLDLNNDGLLDLVKGLSINNNDVKETHLNNGNGEFTLDMELSIPNVFAFLDSSTEKINNKLRIIDINSDGLFDFVSSYNVNGQNYQSIQLNNGKGEFIENNDISLDFSFADYDNNEFVRKNDVFNVDLNNDGNIDFLKNYQADTRQEYYLASLSDYKPSGKLKKIISSSGSEVLVKYQSSSYYLDEDDNNANDSLPFIYDTVNEIDIINDDQIDKEYYQYEQGAFLYHDVYNREFVGFGIVSTYDNEKDKYVKEYYHQGGAFDGSENGEFEDNKYKKGKLYRSEVYAKLNGEDFEKVSEIQNKWESEEIAQDSFFVYLETSLSLRNETDGSLMKANQYFYDDYGNLTLAIDYGEVENIFDYNNINDIGDDKYITQIDYTTGEVQKKYKDKVFDYNNNLLNYQKYYYDHLPLGEASNGFLTKKSDWIDNTDEWSFIEYNYNEQGNLISTMNSLGIPFYYSYDETGDYKISETNSLGHTNNYTYNKLTGEIKTTVDANGFEVNKEFDPLGRIIETKNSRINVDGLILINQIEYNFTERGQEIILEENSSLNNFIPIRTKYFYDRLNQLVQIKKETSAGILTYSIEYLPSGKIENKTIPYLSDDLSFSGFPEGENLYIKYSYDALDRPISEDNSLGNITKIYFLLAEENYDLENKKIRKEFDARGNLISLLEYIDGREIITNFVYNYNNQLVGLIDDDSNVRNFEINNQNQYTYVENLHNPEEENFDSKYFTYDLLGRKISESDNLDNYSINYEYDDLNRIISKSETLDDTNYQLNYDEGNNSLGKLTSIISDNYSKYFSYDLAGNLTEEIININDNEFITFYEYDDLNRLTSIIYPNGEEIFYEYDDYNNIIQIARENGDKLVAKVKYNLLGQKESLLYGNDVVQTYEYDENQLYRLTSKKAFYSDFSNSNPEYLQNFSYTYSPNGNLTNLSNQSLGNPLEIWEYDYDDLNRLTGVQKQSESNSYSIEYDYDDIGNLSFKSDVGYYNYDSVHPQAVSQIGDNYFVYDNRGNLTSHNDYVLDFDAYNRLSGASNGDNNINYQYDFNDFLVAKNINEDQTEYYVNNLFQKNNDKEINYIFLQDQKVAKIEYDINVISSANGYRDNVFYYLTDHLNGTNILTDRNGNIVERVEYYPFGGSVIDTDENRSDYKYNGKLYEGDLGLYYYGHRFYNPQVGRFISIDPLQNDIPNLVNISQNSSQYLNSYSYANNNPLKYTDPDGDVAILAALAVAAVVGAATDVVIEMGIQMYQNKSFDLTKIDYRAVGKAALVGAAVGVATCGVGKIFSAIKGANKVRKLARVANAVDGFADDVPKISKAGRNMLANSKVVKYAPKNLNEAGEYIAEKNIVKINKYLTKAEEIATINHEAIHYKDAKLFGIIGKQAPNEAQMILSETRAYWDEVYRYGRKGMEGAYKYFNSLSKKVLHDYPIANKYFGRFVK